MTSDLGFGFAVAIVLLGLEAELLRDGRDVQGCDGIGDIDVGRHGAHGLQLPDVGHGVEFLSPSANFRKIHQNPASGDALFTAWPPALRPGGSNSPPPTSCKLLVPPQPRQDAHRCSPIRLRP